MQLLRFIWVGALMMLLIGFTKPANARFIEADPVGLDGGPNRYTYVNNNPINYVDPVGLYTEIIIWQPVGHWQSSFGHVSANVNGRNFSWGPAGWDRKIPNTADYIKRQATFRSGVGLVLNLTPEQERRLVDCYAKKRKDYSAISNNCGDPHKDCLEEVLGTSVSKSFFPVNIGYDLLDSKYFKEPTFYLGPPRGFWDDGFWAR